MKKFFKALALVLALVLVVGTVPASAADTYNIVAKRNLYITLTDDQNPNQPTARGTKTEADGTITACKTRARLTYAKLLGISPEEAEKHTISVVSTDDSIVKANDETQAVRAYSIGYVTLTITVDGKKQGTVEVHAKKSSTDDTIVFGTKEGYVNESNTKLAVNKEYQLSLPRGGVDTDVRTLVVKNDKGEDITKDVAVEKLDEKGKGTRLWTLKFTKAGEYTIQGFAYQSKTYNNIISQSKVLTVTVNDPTFVGNPVQVNEKSFKLTFEEDAVLDKNVMIAAFRASTTSVYYLIGEAKAGYSYVDDITINGNVATVKMTSDFVGGTEYFVDYNGNVGSFVADAATEANIDHLEIGKTSVPVGVLTNLELKAITAKGVDITNSVNGSFNVDLKSSDDAIADVSVDEIEFKKVGNVTVSGKASVWNDEKGEYREVPVTSATVSSYDGNEIVGFQYRIVHNTKGNLNWWDGVGTNMQYVSVEDAGYVLQVLVQKKDQNAGNSWGWINVSSADDLSFKVTNDKMLGLDSDIDSVVSSNASAGVGLVPFKEGVTTITVQKYNADTEKYTPVATLPITVRAARKPSTVKVEVVNSRDTLNLSNGSDSIEFKVTVLDQFNNPLEGATVSAAQTNQEKVKNANKVQVAGGTTALPTAWNAGTANIKIYASDDFFTDADGNDIAAKTKYTLSFKASKNNGSKEISSQFTITREGAIDKWVVEGDSKTINSGVKKDAGAESAAFEVYGMSGRSRVAAGNIVFTTATDVTTLTGSQNTIFVRVERDGVVQTIGSGATDYNGNYINDQLISRGAPDGYARAGKLTVNANNGPTTGSYQQLKAGTYRIYFFKVGTDGKAVKTPIATRQVVVTNNQNIPSVKQTVDHESGALWAVSGDAITYTLKPVSAASGSAISNGSIYNSPDFDNDAFWGAIVVNDLFTVQDINGIKFANGEGNGNVINPGTIVSVKAKNAEDYVYIVSIDVLINNSDFWAGKTLERIITVPVGARYYR